MLRASYFNSPSLVSLAVTDGVKASKFTLSSNGLWFSNFQKDYWCTVYQIEMCGYQASSFIFPIRETQPAKTSLWLHLKLQLGQEGYPFLSSSTIFLLRSFCWVNVSLSPKIQLHESSQSKDKIIPMWIICLYFFYLQINPMFRKEQNM